MTASSSSRCMAASACGRMRSTSSAAMSAADNSAMNISQVYGPEKRSSLMAASTRSACGDTAPTRLASRLGPAVEPITAR